MSPLLKRNFYLPTHCCLQTMVWKAYKGLTYVGPVDKSPARWISVRGWRLSIDHARVEPRIQGSCCVHPLPSKLNQGRTIWLTICWSRDPGATCLNAYSCLIRTRHQIVTTSYAIRPSVVLPIKLCSSEKRTKFNIGDEMGVQSRFTERLSQVMTAGLRGRTIILARCMGWERSSTRMWLI